MSWCLPAKDLSLEAIWAKYEDFCKPQIYEGRARCDLLISFKQGNWSVDQWYNVVQAQVPLTKYPPETASILYRDIFWFFLKGEEFFSKTINDSNIDLEKFPASKVRQLAKKMESSKSINRHIKAVASDPQVAQVNLLRHQRTDLQQAKASRNNIPTSLDQRFRRDAQIKTRMKDHPLRKNLIQTRHIKEEIDVPSVVILNTLKVSSVLQESANAEIVRDMDNL